MLSTHLILVTAVLVWAHQGKHLCPGKFVEILDDTTNATTTPPFDVNGTEVSDSLVRTRDLFCSGAGGTFGNHDK